MLDVRSRQDELMDAEDLAPETYDRVLRDLARVNTVTMARRPTLDFLGRLRRDDKPIRILDVGFGDGDMLRTIASWGTRRSIPVELVGIDLNPRSAPSAVTRTPSTMTIDYRTGDYAALANEPWDAIISSLVAHHMTHEQLVDFLKFMEQHARRGWFVNDLHRHGFAWTGFPLLATLMGAHSIVRHDGQLSIARSYRPPEWPPLLAEAGVTGARVFRQFPFRLCVERRR